MSDETNRRALAPHGEAVPDTEWLIAQREDARAKVREWTDTPREQGNRDEQIGYWRGYDHALGLVMARRVNHRAAPAARVTSEELLDLYGAVIAEAGSLERCGDPSSDRHERDQLRARFHAALDRLIAAISVAWCNAEQVQECARNSFRPVPCCRDAALSEATNG